MQHKERKLGIWERYLTVWVAVCIVAGTLVGRMSPIMSELLAKLEVAHISIPIAICLFAMIYPIMVQISFGEVKKAVRSPRPILLTLIMNWAIKPFTMALFAWIFLRLVFSAFLDPAEVYQYRAGLILLGVAPCTAMVLMWSYLARGNMAHTLVMTAINSLSMVILYAPLATFLPGISGISVPWKTIALAVIIYICSPLVAGWITRRQAIKNRGREWFEQKLLPPLGKMAIIALLITLVVLFTYQGEKIIKLPALIGMITAAIFVNILLIFALSYVLAKAFRLGYEDAAPTAIIAVATTLFGVTSGAALATVIGVLIEVPIMLFLVQLCKMTQGFFSCERG